MAARLNRSTGQVLPTQLAAGASARIGPSDERLYAPWGPNARVVRGPRDFEQIRSQDPNLDQHVCHMMDLSVEKVVGAANELLAATATPAEA